MATLGDATALTARSRVDTDSGPMSDLIFAIARQRWLAVPM
jgi:hypothetical protein